MLGDEYGFRNFHRHNLEVRAFKAMLVSITGLLPGLVCPDRLYRTQSLNFLLLKYEDKPPVLTFEQTGTLHHEFHIFQIGTQHPPKQNFWSTRKSAVHLFTDL